MEIVVQVFTKKSRIPVMIPVKNADMLFQMFTKKSFTDVQTSFHDVPNQPRITSAMPFSVFRILEYDLYLGQKYHNLNLIDNTKKAAKTGDTTNVAVWAFALAASAAAAGVVVKRKKEN